MGLKVIWKLISMYGKRKLFVYSMVVILQSVFGAVTVTMFAPIAKYVLNDEQEISILGIEGIEFKSLIMVFISMLVVSTIVNISIELMRAKFIAKYSVWLREKVLLCLMNKSYSYYAANDSAVIQQVANHYTPMVIMLINNWLAICSNAIIVLGLLLVAFASSPLLASALGVMGVGSYLLIGKLFSPRRKNISKAMDSSQGLLQSISTQMIRSNKLMRIHQKLKYYLEGYNRQAWIYSKGQATIPVLSTIPKYLIEAIVLVTISLYMLYLKTSGELATFLPLLSIMVFVAFKVLPVLQNIYGVFNVVSSLGYVADRVYEVFEDPSENYEEVIEDTSEPEQVFESLELRNVTFSHDQSAEQICYPNILIKKEEVVAFTGPSGCGKSTLMDILLGLHSIESGEIFLNGKLASSVDLRGLYSSLGYVGQETYLINSSIAENIGMCDIGTVDFERLENACKQAQIYDFVINLSEGYNTPVGDNGIRISGGQRQRLSIARALYRNPKLLLLDEACSALDEETEHRIMDTILTLPEEITVILITHRMSSLAKVKNVIKLQAP